MLLITSPGQRDSNSYVTVDEADTRITETYRAELSDTWMDLSEDMKIHKLTLGALFLEGMKYRGVKACRDQALSFPRWSRHDLNYPMHIDQYIEMSDIPIAPVDRYHYHGSPPAVPEEIKIAQIEMTFQVIHSYLLTDDSEPLEYPDHEIRSFTLGGGMTIDYFSTAHAQGNIYAKAKLTSAYIIDVYLQRWRRFTIGGAV